MLRGEGMTTSQTVVVGVDFSDYSQIALDAAIDQSGDGELHALCVLDLPASRLSKGPPLSIQEASATLTQVVEARLTEKAGQAGKLRAFIHIRLGVPARELADLAREVGADLLVVGTHGRRGMRRLFLGSVAERVLRAAPCPVLVARAPAVAGREVAPEPELACADCKAIRGATRGEQWWCETHRSHPHRSHGYSRHLDYSASASPLW